MKELEERKFDLLTLLFQHFDFIGCIVVIRETGMELVLTQTTGNIA